MFNSAVFRLEPPEAPTGFKLEDYNVDYATGFFPPEPLPRLTGRFEIWEDALDDAEGQLSLGEDTRESAKVKRPYGEAWRERVRKVRVVTALRRVTTDTDISSVPRARYRSLSRGDSSPAACPYGSCILD